MARRNPGYPSYSSSYHRRLNEWNEEGNDDRHRYEEEPRRRHEERRSSESSKREREASQRDQSRSSERRANEYSPPHKIQASSSSSTPPSWVTTPTLEREVTQPKDGRYGRPKYIMQMICKLKEDAVPNVASWAKMVHRVIRGVQCFRKAIFICQDKNLPGGKKIWECLKSRTDAFKLAVLTAYISDWATYVAPFLQSLEKGSCSTDLYRNDGGEQLHVSPVPEFVNGVEKMIMFALDGKRYPLPVLSQQEWKTINFVTKGLPSGETHIVWYPKDFDPSVEVGMKSNAQFKWLRPEVQAWLQDENLNRMAKPALSDDLEKILQMNGHNHSLWSSGGFVASLYKTTHCLSLRELTNSLHQQSQQHAPPVVTLEGDEERIPNAIKKLEVKQDQILDLLQKVFSMLQEQQNTEKQELPNLLQHVPTPIVQVHPLPFLPTMQSHTSPQPGTSQYRSPPYQQPGGYPDTGSWSLATPPLIEGYSPTNPLGLPAGERSPAIQEAARVGYRSTEGGAATVNNGTQDNETAAAVAMIVSSSQPSSPRVPQP